MSDQEESFDEVPTVIHSRRRKIQAQQKKNKLTDDITGEIPKKKDKGLELLMEQLKKNQSKTALASERPLPPPGPDQPHDSAYTHSALIGKHTLGVLPTLNTDEKGNSQTIIFIALLVLTFFAAWGAAYGVQIALTPHVAGVCPAPAVIEKGGCFRVETSTGANGASVSTLIPAGSLAP